jgi:hypothetical protein
MLIKAIADENLDVFARLADLIIPHGEEMPSATEADVASVWIHRVLGLRADLRPDLMRALQKARNADSLDALKQALAEDRAAFVALTMMVANAYYLNPEVRRRIGYDGHNAHPFDADETAEYAANGMLDRVLARGPIYRSTPSVSK